MCVFGRYGGLLPTWWKGLYNISFTSLYQFFASYFVFCIRGKVVGGKCEVITFLQIEREREREIEGLLAIG